jgi:hypothetical protein
MNKLIRELEAGIEELQRDLDDPDNEDRANMCQWMGAWMPCLASSLRSGEVMQFGGVETIVSLSLIILAKHLPAQGGPKLGDTIGYLGRWFRVVGAARAPHGGSWRYDLAELTAES